MSERTLLQKITAAAREELEAGATSTQVVSRLLVIAIMAVKKHPGVTKDSIRAGVLHVIDDVWEDE